jgi:glycosyltransferase involved in cell wall biosynthesis
VRAIRDRVGSVAVRASLIIPTRNRARFLARTLAALRHQRAADFEIVIADDGSDDNTREIVLAAQGELEIRYLRRAKVGVAAARNAAIRAARGDVLILCDDDRIADPGLVGDHLAAHAEGTPCVAVGRQRGLFAAWSADAAYSAVDVASLLARQPALAPRLAESSAELVTLEMIRDDLPGVVAGFELAEPWWEGYARVVLERWGATLEDFAFPWTLGVGGNCSMPRALAEQVGLHDERFVGWGLEDNDLHYRLHRAGARTVILEGGLNYHQVHRRGPERAWEWARNALYMIDKHDALDVTLYLTVCRRRLSLEDANRIAREHAALGDSARHLVAELIRLSKEQLRLLVAASP